jgi:hypothetical protein
MRTLLTDKALLLDEPFSKLDVMLRQRIRSFVFDEVRRYGLPAILVTHDPEEAAAGGGPAHQLGTSLWMRRLRLDPAALVAQTCDAIRQAGWRGAGGSEMLPARQAAKADRGEPDSGRLIGETPGSSPNP